MLIYWAFYAVPALPALLRSGRGDTARSVRVPMALFVLLLALFVGLRYEVGTDWGNYQAIVDATRDENLSTTLSYGDPAFGLLSWISTHVGLNMLGPNIVCASILLFGLWRFSRRQPQPWMALAVSVPYLIIVVGMGYVRQAAAIGFLFVAINRLERDQTFGFLKWLAAAAVFHVTVLSVLPIALYALARRSVGATVGIVVTAVGLNLLLLRSRVETFSTIYTDSELQSSGALSRLLINIAPAIMFVIFRSRFNLSPTMRGYWTAVTGLLFLFLAVAWTGSFTTAVDRLALYCFPLQIFVATRLALLSDKPEGRFLINFGILLFYGITLYIWLNYATYSSDWLPYQLYPLEQLG